MSDASDRLARTRLAIIRQIENREERQQRGSAGRRRGREQASADGSKDTEPPGSGGGSFDHLRHVVRTWWRYHPAHMGLELATPALSAYAARKPLQFLGIAAAVGAIVVVARPWRLISVTGLLVAIAKSSQLSGVLMSALSAADYQKDREPYE